MQDNPGYDNDINVQKSSLTRSHVIAFIYGSANSHVTEHLNLTSQFVTTIMELKSSEVYITEIKGLV